MIRFDEALALVQSAARPIASEIVALNAAHGRVLAKPLVAHVDSPPAHVSAMDGYAVRDEDLAALPARLAIVGESFAGLGFPGALSAGECVRIFTGAPVPAETSRVVIQEIVRRDGSQALFETAPGAGRNIRLRGSDFRCGDVLLDEGRLLDPRAIVAAAAADVGELEVWEKPKVAILSTGDELAEPGSARDRPGSIPESVSPGVAALAEEWGAAVVARTRLRDELAAMEGAASEALSAADLVVVTGGASVGERDFAKAMFEPAGLEIIFSKVAIKPGKPVWLGRVGSKLVLGLPGNPTSAMVTARLLLAPLIAGMTGRDPSHALRWREAMLTGPMPGCGERETFVRATSSSKGVSPIENQDSGAQKVLAAADLLVRRRPNATAGNAGDSVEVIDF